MNCKEGDIAIVVSAKLTPEMIGYIVKIERRSIYGVNHYDEDFPSWVCSGNNIPTRCLDGDFSLRNKRVIQDKYLRPIKDSDEEDEMLKITRSIYA